MKVWIIHFIKVERYEETVVFLGVATSETQKERIVAPFPEMTEIEVTEIETDRVENVKGAVSFHETPNW